MIDAQAAVFQHPLVQRAQEAVEAAKTRFADVEKEVQGLRSALVDLEGEIESVTRAGDPRGIVRDLSRERRELRAALEDAQADLAACGHAVDGAVEAKNHAVLEAMGEVWAAVDLEGPEQRFREAVTDALGALDELDALTEQHSLLAGWARHIIGNRLGGEGTFPQLREPNPGAPITTYREAASAIRRLAANMTTEEQAAA